MTTLYGIKNCDTVKKTRAWLEAQDVGYRFHDFRVDGLDAATLSRWAKVLGWETLLNRRSTTWRNLPDAQKDSLDEQHAIALMLQQPTLIKRPVLDHNGELTIGFKTTEYEAMFAR